MLLTVSRNKMLALVLYASVLILRASTQCVLRPPCSTTGMYQTNTTCCLFCPAGHACRSSVLTPCNVTAGQYQPLTRKSDCLNASDCASWQYQSVPGTPTSARQCAVVRNCSLASEVQTMPPTATTDRTCVCAEGRISSGTSNCLLCSVFMSGCLTCTNDTTCTSCRESFYLSTGQHSECYACTMPGCDRCDKGTAFNQTCAECRNTHYMDATRTCRECALPGCTQCRSATQCSQCTSGHVLNGSTCVCAVSRCAECNAVGCVVCDTGFEGKDCRAAHCAVYSTQACAVCDNGYTLTPEGTCTTVSDTYCLQFNGSVCSACRDGRPPENGACPATTAKASNMGISVGIAGVGVVICVIIIAVVVNRVIKGRTHPDRVRTNYQRPPAVPSRRRPDVQLESWNEPMYAEPAVTRLPSPQEEALYDIATFLDRDPTYDLASDGYVDVES